ncbi:hypothetical protein [Falsiroseomonas sp. HW251]|uniref:hypothetical protein n=1 Tax=Falsiroseomonas sp. HW251 TaxID=3390998 RepID=UPI003D30F0F6
MRLDALIPDGGPQTAIRAALDLAALVRETVSAEAGREVLHLSLASLAAPLRRPNHRRLLRDMLDTALASSRTRIFELPNGDLVAVARAPAPGLLAAEAALRRGLDEAGETGALRRLRLPADAAALLATVSEALGLEPGEARPIEAPSGGRPLDTAELAAAERALAQAELEPMTRAQQVCRLDPNGDRPETIWEDRRVDWAALAAAVLPGRDLGAAPGLLRRLRRAAEQRLLAGILRPASLLAWKPVGLALSPATIEGAAFARFAESLPAGRAAEVTIGLRAAEMLADPVALPRLAALLRRRGFRVALDEVRAGLLAMLPPERLPVDLLRLAWSPSLPVDAPPAIEPLAQAAPERIVLTGVDRAAAIAWGWEAGLRLFQGPLVERRRAA